MHSPSLRSYDRKGLCRSKRSSAFFVRSSGCALFYLGGDHEKNRFISFVPLAGLSA